LILCVLRDGYHSEQTVPTFGEQVVAMEAKAKTLGISGKLHYVYPNGHNYGLPSDQVHVIQHAGVNPRHIVGDLHASDGGACYRDAHKPRMDCPSGVGFARQAMAGKTHSPYFNQSYANLETNVGLHDMGRALLEAADLNKWLALTPPLSESLLVRTGSFCMERSGHFDSWDLTDQGMTLCATSFRCCPSVLDTDFLPARRSASLVSI